MLRCINSQKLHCSGKVNPPFSAVIDYCSEKQARLLLVHINFCLKSKPVLLQWLHRYLLWCLSVALSSSGLLKVHMSSWTESHLCETLWYDQLMWFVKMIPHVNISFLLSFIPPLVLTINTVLKLIAGAQVCLQMWKVCRSCQSVCALLHTQSWWQELMTLCMSLDETQGKCRKLLSFKSCRRDLSRQSCSLAKEWCILLSASPCNCVCACHSHSPASVLNKTVSLSTPVCGLLTFPTTGVPHSSFFSFLGMPQSWITCHGNETSTAFFLATNSPYTRCWQSIPEHLTPFEIQQLLFF